MFISTFSKELLGGHWTTSLVQSCFDLLASCANINDFISMVHEAPTSQIFTTSIAWRDTLITTMMLFEDIHLP
jgi:hypothetical protein